MSASFDYSNLPVRPSGRGVRLLERLSPGIRRTQAQVGPYARAWEEHNTNVARLDGPLWIVLGDSMAQGIGASAYDRGWPGQLADRLARRYRMVNLSAYGARVCDVVDRQWPVAQQLGSADFISVVIGSNDLWRNRRDALPDAFAGLIELLPPGTLVSNMPNPTPAADAVNHELATRGRRRGLIVANLRANRISWRGKLAPDHFHPNDAGYAAMADVMAAALPASARK